LSCHNNQNYNLLCVFFLFTDWTNKTKKMWRSVLVLLTLVAYVDAFNNVTAQCPQKCKCHMTFWKGWNVAQGTDSNPVISKYEMYIDCGQQFRHINEEQLSRQIDIMLSADQFIEQLTSLSISNTPLTRVPASVCNLVTLTSLHLDSNKLTVLPGNCFNNLTKLVTLSANRNSITGLQDGLFDGMPSLVTLDLSNNHISFIGLQVFSNSSDLTSLRYLYLIANRLTSLEPWWYYRCILGDEKSPVTIDLNNNLISNFTNKLNFHFRCDMKRPYGRLDLSWNRITHIMDVFKGWNIESLYIARFLCLKNFKGGSPRMHFSLAGYYSCDCIDFPFYKYLKTIPRDTT